MKNRIRELRARHRLSQADLGERLNVSRQTIHAIENDKYDPSLSIAFLLSHIFNEPVEEIFNKENFLKNYSNDN
jgi:putative transcriptional regulator